ncbi:DUF4393 domain-containing protein [Lysinibacillus sp. M3]|uniref:DUF4393 domain-containing protein n=1 Tax=Lysinibacillus zambalensis TaxID=3160866 RepID=A0ABV1MN68_9BACI
MDPITTSAITKVATEAVKEVSKESKEPRKTFDDLWYLTFGKLGLSADKLRIRHQIDLENYKASIIKKIESIPDENLQEPKMSIVGPAIDIARFYIEEEILREMFAKVISSSFDKTKSNSVHHSFVEIIKQITPIEAKLLTLFKESFGGLPCASLEITNKENSFIELQPVYIKGFLDDLKTGEEYSLEISNLIRLNLISESPYYLDDFKDEYNFFTQATYFKNFAKMATRRGQKVRVKGKQLKLTPLGEKLVIICL